MDEYEDIKTPEQKAMKAMEEVNEHKAVDDIVLTKERKPLTPEQKKHISNWHRNYEKRTYRRYIWLMRYDQDHDIIDYIENMKTQGVTPTQLMKDLVRKELEK